MMERQRMLLCPFYISENRSELRKALDEECCKPSQSQRQSSLKDAIERDVITPSTKGKKATNIV